MPRTHLLYGNRSKFHDDSVQLSHRSNVSTLLRSSPGSSISRFSSTSSSNPPHRLRDNLHWRCSNCNSLVVTSETGAHLIDCLIDLVEPFIGSGLYVDFQSPNCSQQANHQMNSMARPAQTIQRCSNDRPRTKKLERPTPNLRHPVIDEITLEADDDDHSLENGISVNDGSCAYRKLINSEPIKSIHENGTNSLEVSKCNLNHRNINKGLGSSNRNVSGWSGGGRIYLPQQPPPAPPSVTPTVRSEITKKVCNSCDRSSAPERLHSHHSKSFHHHHHHNHNHLHHNNSRVNVSPTKDKSIIKEANNNIPKSPLVKSSQRVSSKVTINNKSTSKVISNSEKPIVHNVQEKEIENDKDEKDDEKGRNKNNLLNNPNKSTDQSSYLSLQMKCYLCRQDFATDEIEIHEIECLEKWKHDSSVSSPNKRVPMVSNQGIIGDGNGIGVDHCGSISSITGCDPAGWEHFKSQLTPCPKCGRTFFPHRLAAHEKACLGPQAGKRSKNGVNQTYNNNPHPIAGKDEAQLNQYPKCTKKSLPGHTRVDNL